MKLRKRSGDINGLPPKKKVELVQRTWESMFHSEAMERDFTWCELLCVNVSGVCSDGLLLYNPVSVQKY